jgi:hypothetical protein
MTSLRQIESNRRNALKTAETVIEPVEDPEDYKAFEQAVTADYDAETAVERELVLRLASLLWRLRRSTLIETCLLQIRIEVLHGRRTRQTPTPSRDCTLVAALRIGRSPCVIESSNAYRGECSVHGEAVPNAETKPELPMLEPRSEIAQRFLRVSNLDNNVFERLGLMRWHSGGKSGRRYLHWNVCGGGPAPVAGGGNRPGRRGSHLSRKWKVDDRSRTETPN